MLRIVIAVCGTLVNLPSVPSAASLAIVPQPVLSLACAGAVVSPAIWPENARRPGAPLFLFLVLVLMALLTNVITIEQLPPSPSPVVYVPVSAQSAPSTAPTTDYFNHVKEE